MILKKLKNINLRSLFLQLFVFALIFSLVSLYQQRHSAKGPAAEISANLINDTHITLSQYLGQPVIVHFWATWCSVCKLENDNIDAIAKDYPVISIASWSNGASSVNKFMQSENLSMPVIVDDKGEWAALYGVKAVPASFLIDAKGVIRFVQIGYTTELGLRLRLWWLENF